MLKLLKQNGIEAAVLTSAVAVLMSLAMFLPSTSAYISAPENGTPLFNAVYNSLFGGVSIWTQILTLFLTAFEAFLLTAMNAGHELTRAKSLFFILVYFVLSLSYVPTDTLLPEQFANVFIIIGFIKILSSHGVDRAEFIFFDAGLFFGLSALFCIPAALMLVFGITALTLYRPYRFSEYAIFIIGFFTPLFLYVSGYFLAEGTLEPLGTFYAERFSIAKKLTVTHNEIITFSLYFVMVLTGSVLILQEYAKYNLFSSRTYRMFFFVFSGVMLLSMTPWFGIQTMRLTAMPLTMLYVTVFNSSNTVRRNVFSEAVFAVFLVLHIGVQVLWYLM